MSRPTLRINRLALWLGIIPALLALAWPDPANARPGLPSSIPAASALCRGAILAAEHAAHLPDRLLDAIAVVESGRRDPVSGTVYPWPWTINVEGVGHFYESKAEVVAAVLDFQAHGARSIDVGCMQINLVQHPTAFASLDQAFDPATNATYAARFLTQLFNQTNAWPLAAAAYHSQTPDIGADYARKVLAAWGVPLPPVGSQSIQSPLPTPSVVVASAAPPGRVAVMLPTGTDAIRVMPLPVDAPTGRSMAAAPAGRVMTTASGRGLDAYRAAPIGLALRMPMGR